MCPVACSSPLREGPDSAAAAASGAGGAQVVTAAQVGGALGIDSGAPEQKQDAARPPADLGVSDGPLFIVVDNPPPEPPQDAYSDLGPLCQTVSSLAYDSGASLFPLDWQTAQSLSAWCGMYKAVIGVASLCLIPNSDGYNQAVITLSPEGELAVLLWYFYLYDPATGELVADLWAESDPRQVTCVFRTPDGPANPTVVWPGSCLEGTPLNLVCAADAGSTN